MRAEYEARCNVTRRCTKASNCPVAKGEEKGIEQGRDLNDLHGRLSASRQAIADFVTTTAGTNGPELARMGKHRKTEYEYPGTCNDYVELKVNISGQVRKFKQ